MTMHVLCQLCGHRWTAEALSDCDGCGGTARVLASSPLSLARINRTYLANLEGAEAARLEAIAEDVARTRCAR